MNELQRVFSQVTALRHHHGDRIADIPDFSGRDRRLLGALQPRDHAGSHRNRLQPRHIGAGKDPDDPWQFQSRCRIDPGDAGVGVGAAQNRCVHHAGAMNIADKFSDAAEKSEVFLAFNSRSNVGHDSFRRPASISPGLLN